MQRLSTSFVLGYHGCDRRVAERLLQNNPFMPSENDYDWLGAGIYFWEGNPSRGLAWAKDLQRHRQDTANRIEVSYVVSAVIDLGLCLDLLSSSGIEMVKAGYRDFIRKMEQIGSEKPRNQGGNDLFFDILTALSSTTSMC